MSVKPWINHPKEDFSTLNVPFNSEKERENECVVYSLKMVIEYVSNYHPENWIRENVSTIELDELRSILTLGEGGWKAKNSESDFRKISEKVGAIQFKHSMRDISPTEHTLVSTVEDHLDRCVPVIPFINARLLRRSKKGGVHAVVVTGITDEYISIQDPWGYPYDIVKRQKFIEAWDDVLNQVISVKLGGQQTLGSERAKEVNIA